nr:hypothetical protein BaRGS_005382 [Batillaria attramentaria]
MAELRYYQAGRSGPFPAGYLGFVDGVSRDNTAFRYCSTSRTSCQIACEVIGQDVTDLSLRRVNADENSAALEAHTTFAFGSWRAEVANIDDVSFSDAGQYECLARSQDQSVITSRILVLEVVTPAKIDYDRSSFTILQNGVCVSICLSVCLSLSLSWAAGMAEW